MSPLDLFDPPDIQTPVPVAPGSETSAMAASKITNPMRARSYRLIFAALAASNKPALSREELSEVTGLKESSLCARLFELRPTWIQEMPFTVGGSSGHRVNVYGLTPAGYRRWNEANQPLELRAGIPKEEAK